MRLFKYIWVLIFLSGTGMMYSQQLKSKKVGIRLNNEPKSEMIGQPDESPPMMKILTPVLDHGNYYKCNVSQLDLIGEVTDESGIKFLTINSDIREINESGVFSTRLRLDPGMNQIRIVTMDNSNNLKEQYIIIEYVPQSISLAERIRSVSTYYGLIIANEDYNDINLPDLLNPIKDADKLYEVLTSSYHFSDTNIRYLRNATRADMIRCLDELAKIVTPNDNLLIYYAGHGWWDPEASNGYWLPSDAVSDEKTNWFRNSALVDYLKEINSKHTLLIADACFGGSIFKTRAATIARDRAYEKLYDLPSRKAMTSGTLTVVPDQSSFAKFLVERLQENEATYLSSEELFISFKLAVINNSDAVPQYGEIGNVGDQGGDFIFLK